MADVLLCGCPKCQPAPPAVTPQAGAARWYVCTRCGLLYQSHFGCGCVWAARAALAEEGSPRGR